MKKIKEIIKKALILACLEAILLFPGVALADSFNLSIGGFSISFGSDGGAGSNSFGLPTGSIIDIVVGVAEWILGIFSAIAIIGFAVAGIKYLTASGSESMIESSKKAMYYSIIGVIVGLSGFVVLQAVNYMLNGSSVF